MMRIRRGGSRAPSRDVENPGFAGTVPSSAELSIHLALLSHYRDVDTNMGRHHSLILGSVLALAAPSVWAESPYQIYVSNECSGDVTASHLSGLE